jgi:hypothetical protein
LIDRKGSDGVKHHIGEVMSCRMGFIELKVNNVGDSGERTIVDEGFAPEVLPVIRGERVKCGAVVTKLWVS